ncbi:MAG: tetratricopeptide repeat protein [Bacteroidota bacterium]
MRLVFFLSCIGLPGWAWGQVAQEVPSSYLIGKSIEAFQTQDWDGSWQWADSAVRVGETTGDETLQGEGHIRKARAEENRGELSEAGQSYQIGLSLLRGNSQGAERAYGWHRFGIYHARQGQFDSALHYLKAAVELEEQLEAKGKVAQIQNDVGLVFQNLGQFDSAMHYYLASALTKQEVGDSLELAKTYGNMGVLYYYEDRFGEAITYYEKSLAVYTALQLPLAQARMEVNLAEALVIQGSYRRALTLLNGGLAVIEQHDDVALYYYGLAVRGAVRYEMGQYTEALQDYEELWQEEAVLGDPRMVMVSYMNAGACYFNLGQYAEAEAAYQRALSDAQQQGVPLEEANALDNLAELYALLGRDGEAYTLMRKHKELREQILNEERTKAVAEMQEKYNTVVQQREIEQLETDAELTEAELGQVRAQRLTAVMAALAILLVAAIGWGWLRQRRRQEAKDHASRVKDLLSAQETQTLEALVEGQDGERRRIAQELHDHFGNQLAALKVNLRGAELPDMEQKGSLLTLVDQVSQDVRNLSHSLHAGMENTFQLVPALEQLRDTLSQSGSLAVELVISLLHPETLSVKQRLGLYRMVQELVSNVLKHAGATELSIQLTEFDDEKLLNILVQDNGRGFDPEAALARNEGMGMAGLRKRVKELDGELDIDSSPGNGATVIIDIPIGN